MKYERDQKGLASMVYKCFDKRSAFIEDKSVSGSGIKMTISQIKN